MTCDEIEKAKEYNPYDMFKIRGLGVGVASRVSKKHGAVQYGIFKLPKYHGSHVYAPFSMHFYNGEGEEIGSYSYDLDCLTIHKRPRTVDPDLHTYRIMAMSEVE